MTTKDKQLAQRVNRLEELLKAETQRAELAWKAYRACISELVDAKVKIHAVEQAMKGTI